MTWRDPAGGDDSGVSAVLGAVLLFGLMVITMVTLRAAFVPAWENDREAEQMSLAQAQVAAVHSAVERLEANQTGLPVTLPLDMPAPHTTFLGTFGAYATVGFTPGTSNLALQADTFRLQARNGESVGGERWKTVINTQPLADVGAVESLRLRFTLTDVAGKHHSRDSVQLQVKDADGVVVGTFALSIECQNNTCDHHDVLFLNVEADDAGGNLLYDQGQGVLPPPDHGNATYWVDVLDPSYRFLQVLRLAPTPYDIVLTDDGLGAQYAVTYKSLTGGVPVLVGGDTATTTLLDLHAAGTLTFAARNQYFPEQSLYLENGAMVLHQPGGGDVMLVPPPLNVGVAGSLVTLGLGVPELVGDASSLQGATNVHVRTTLDDSASYAGLAPRLTMNFTTQFPALYARWLQSSFAAHGLTSAGCATADPACIYEVRSGPTWALVDVRGFTVADPTGAVMDVALEVRSSTVHVELLP